MPTLILYSLQNYPAVASRDAAYFVMVSHERLELSDDLIFSGKVPEEFFIVEKPDRESRVINGGLHFLDGDFMISGADKTCPVENYIFKSGVDKFFHLFKRVF